jgi:hypothetical protein
MLFCIARRLARLEADNLGAIAHPASQWLRENCTALFTNQSGTFDIAWDALRKALEAGSGQHRFAAANRRWVDESLNSAAGRMLDALFQYQGWKDLKEGEALPEALSVKLDEMLSLRSDDRRYAIVMIASKLLWLFRIDAQWVETRMLPLTSEKSVDNDAFWAGFFWAARVPKPALYEKLKQSLIDLASKPSLPKEQANNLAGILLLEWVRGRDMTDREPLVSDVELREVLIHAGDDLRTWMLWNLRRFARKPELPIADKLVQFFRGVWPRQRTMRSPEMTGKLVELALSAPDRFSEIVDVLLPRLVPIEHGSTVLASAVVDQQIFTDHARALLDLLSVVLPPDAETWPYGAGEILRLLEQRPETRDDPRLATLLRSAERV